MLRLGFDVKLDKYEVWGIEAYLDEFEPWRKKATSNKALTNQTTTFRLSSPLENMSLGTSLFVYHTKKLIISYHKKINNEPITELPTST